MFSAKNCVLCRNYSVVNVNKGQVEVKRMACPGSRISCHMKMGSTLWMATEVHILKFNVIQLLFKCRHLVTHLFTDNFFIYEQQSNNHACYFSLGSLLLHLGSFRIYLLLSFFLMWKEDFMKTLLGTRGHWDCYSLLLSVKPVLEGKY